MLSDQTIHLSNVKIRGQQTVPFPSVVQQIFRAGSISHCRIGVGNPIFLR